MRIASLLFTTLFAAVAGFSFAQPAPFTDRLLRDEKLWGDGNAEFTVFKAVEPRYGTPQETEVRHYLVRENFAPEAPVKADDWRRAGTYPVIKLNQIWTVPTGSYRYDQGVSLFWRAADAPGAAAGSLLRFSHTTSDTCGLTYKRADLAGGAWRYRAFTYWENGDELDHRSPAPAGGIFYDELPFKLRTLDWGKLTLFEAPLLPSLVGSKPDPELRWQTARFNIEKLREGWRVTVRHAGGADRLIFDAESPHALQSWHRADGGKLERVHLVRLPYWRLNQPGDERYAAPGATYP
jgi:hypothetical protein